MKPGAEGRGADRDRIKPGAEARGADGDRMEPGAEVRGIRRGQMKEAPGAAAGDPAVFLARGPVLRHKMNQSRQAAAQFRTAALRPVGETIWRGDAHEAVRW